MKNIVNLMVATLTGVAFSLVIVKWVDNSFIQEYSYATGIPVEAISIADTESECFEDEYFDSTYGLCIAVQPTPTDSDVGL